MGKEVIQISVSGCGERRGGACFSNSEVKEEGLVYAPDSPRRQQAETSSKESNS